MDRTMLKPNPRWILGAILHFFRGCDPRECIEGGDGALVCSRCGKVQ